MAPRAATNQLVQIGVESVPGTTVAAGKLLGAFTWTFGEKSETKQFTATGHKYPSASEMLSEFSEGKISGEGDFAALVYPVSSCFGAATIALHSGATVANDWTFTPPITGAASPKTYTVQQGNSVDDSQQYGYLIFSGWGYSFGRKTEVTIEGEWFSQTFTDGITMTATPTNIALTPMTGAQMNVYLDTSSSGLGTTQLADPLKVDFKGSDFYNQYWPINRTNQSFTSHIDKKPKNELKLLLQANTTGIAIRGNYLQTGTRCYVRVSGQGPVIENDWTVGVGAASAGNFTLSFKGQTTANIAYNALASAVQSALRLLSTIGNTGCTVTGTAPNWVVQLTGALATDTADALTGNGGGLTGGALTITAAPIYAGFTHDMACFVSGMSEFSDSDDVYAVEYTLAVAEDTGWGSAPGTAQKLVITNLLSAL